MAPVRAPVGRRGTIGAVRILRNGRTLPLAATGVLALAALAGCASSASSSTGAAAAQVKQIGPTSAYSGFALS